MNTLTDVVAAWASNKPMQFEVEDTYQCTEQQVVFAVQGREMLRINPQGFWVEGVLLDQAPKVYKSFCDWLVWAQLNRA
jgi:hypothetical protein